MQLVNSHTYINADYNIDLLQMHKNIWKSAINDEKYENIKVDFKTYQKIFSDGIQNAKHQYYFNTLISHKNDMKKTPLKPTDETLTNVFSANIGAILSTGNNQSNCAQYYSDYFSNPTPHRFTLTTINESYDLA